MTLTAAATVYFAEMYWTPGSMIQAEDRSHRIGQIAQVNVVYFLARDTIDDILWPLLKSKMKTLGEVFEGNKNVDLDIDSKKSDSSVPSAGRDTIVEGIVYLERYYDSI